MEIKKTYLDNINYFRGIAIIFIVFGHCITFGIIRFDENITFLGKLIKVFAVGGTTFFVFISGYLLHYIHYGKLQFNDFILKKIKYVVLPFLCFSSLDIIYYLMRFLFSNIFSSNSYDLYFEKLKSLDLIKIYLLGHSELTIGLWYVPFVIVMFSLSSFFLKLIVLNFKIQLYVIGILIFVSLIVHRTHDDRISGIFQNVLYFIPVYLLGIFVSANHKVIYRKMIGKEIYFLITALIISIFQVKIGKLETIKDFSEIGFKNLDLMLFQKLFLSMFLLLCLTRVKNNALLNAIASNSFGIFFIHGIYIWMINAIVFKFKIVYYSNSIFIFFLNASIILVLSLLTTILFKKFFPKKSKYIIGC